MARRTQVLRVMPWVGGVNTSVDSGVLNPQELVQADNVVFSATGARIKREALEYLDPAVPSPDFRSSSGTTRTLKWTTTALVGISPKNEKLVVGERITVTGVSNYNVNGVVVSTITEIPQTVEITCVADVSSSLNSTYFLLPAGDDGSMYYVWLNVDGNGIDPAVPQATGIEVTINENDGAATVATAVASIINAEADFSASSLGSLVTVTNVVGGLTETPEDVDTGFTITVTVKGGHEITYEASSSLSESETAAGPIAIDRASSVIAVCDYWRYDGSYNNNQDLVYATNYFQLFSLDSSGRRKQVKGQEQVTSVVCGDAASLTTGDYFLIDAGNAQNYYVWYNKDSGGGDPAIAGRTGIEVTVTTGDTASQVASATHSVIDVEDAFSATVNSATVTITNANAGIAVAAEDVNTGFGISTTMWGATAPTEPVDQIRMMIFQERLIITMTGVDNYPILYRPEDNAKYQVLVADPVNSCPDGSFAFEHLGRVWMNDKKEPHRIHYSETFDFTLWLGFGDSGALDVYPGDGDSVGITNAFPYKGLLMVGKKDKLYRVQGDSPELFTVQLVSNGIGCEGNLAIPVDQADVIFVSRRGFHSQVATDTYGDTDATFLSAKIQPTFNVWNPTKRGLTQGAYIPQLNSIAFAVAEQGQNSQNAVWLFNPEVQLPDGQRGAWYRWPDISCTALGRRLTSDKYKLIFGTNNGRIIQAQKDNSYADFGTDGIEYKVKTGAIYTDGDAASIKAFKKISMIYRPKGNFTFVVKANIDNFPAQSFGFNEISGLDTLGETFILGSSLLGSSATLAPFTFSMDGLGRGIILEVSQTSPNEQVEIWGFEIEYEIEDRRQETN